MPVAPDARQFVMVGICGGFTTFSSFSLQTLELARDGDLPWPPAAMSWPVVVLVPGRGLARPCRRRRNQSDPLTEPVEQPRRFALGLAAR